MKQKAWTDRKDVVMLASRRHRPMTIVGDEHRQTGVGRGEVGANKDSLASRRKLIGRAVLPWGVCCDAMAGSLLIVKSSSRLVKSYLCCDVCQDDIEGYSKQSGWLTRNRNL